MIDTELAVLRQMFVCFRHTSRHTIDMCDDICQDGIWRISYIHVPMDHYTLYARVRNRLLSIVYLVLLLGLIAVFVSVFEQRQFALHSIRFIALCFVGYYLLEGRKWALFVFVLIAILTFIKSFIGLLGTFNTRMTFFYLPFTIIFGYISYYLITNKNFELYSRLREYGFRFSPGNQKTLAELIDPKEFLVFDTKQVNTPEAYIQWISDIFGTCGIRDKIISIAHEEDHFNIETENAIYAVVYNTHINLFDKKVLDGINGILKILELPVQFYYVWPESVLQKPTSTCHLAALDADRYFEIKQHGYIRE